MTKHRPDVVVNRPGALIAALPAMLGFAPEKSLVLVLVKSGELGSVMRVDLGDQLIDRIDRFVQVAAAASPEAAIAVIVDSDGAQCSMCSEQHRDLCEALAEELSRCGIVLWAAHVVDRVASGGRWHCVDGCGSGGVIDDPSTSPLALAAVVEGRRLYSRRADLQAVIEVDDPVRCLELVSQVRLQASLREVAYRSDPLGCGRRDVEKIMAAAEHVAAGKSLTEGELAELGCALTDLQVRDTVYALAIGEIASAAETLWALLARRLPEPWRVEALVLLAFTAYARGDGPLAGVALDTALRCMPDHRMGGMLDSALQSGLRPERIRELALTGYRLAEQLGVRLPSQQISRRRAV
ncbi:MAG: DUF4192 domain-containing protein [Mycobacteriaceae bacterium]|nr:DUF4192 domain-containing protein [Mycobacteriaceae bacterium]